MALALQQTIAARNASVPAVAAAFGVCVARVKRFLDPFDDAAPNELHLVRCRIADRELRDEYKRQVESLFEEEALDASPSSIVLAVLAVDHEAADVSKALEEALGDKHTPGVITPAEAMVGARECAEGVAALLRAQRLFEKVARGSR